MDIRTDTDDRAVTVFPDWLKAVIGALAAAGIFSWYTHGIMLAFPIFALILVVTGCATAHAWNSEVQQDGYAALGQLYGSYAGAIFLFVSIAPLLMLNLSMRLGVIGGTITAILYAGLLRLIAYHNLDGIDREIDPYEGPAVVYKTEGPYIDHVEELARQASTEQ